MPEELFSKLKKSIPVQLKYCFASSLIFGLIAHLYKLTSWLPNWDSLVFRYDPQNMTAIGRWFLPVACAPSSFYDLPWLAGLLAIIFHGLGAVCICKMFDVQKKTTAVMIGAAVITFPTVTSVLMYNYVADGYALAFLLSCVAALLLVGEKPRYIAAVICITLSAGIYQAYITVTIMLLLCFLIIDALRKDISVGKLMVKSLKFLLSGAIGMVLYYAVLNVILKLTDTALLDYQGFSDAASLAKLDITGTFYTIKNSFIDYFFSFSNGLSVFTVLNCLIFALTVILYVAQIIKNKTSIAKLAFIGACAVLLPIGASVLAFINSEIDYHNLMKMGFFVFYLFLILQYEKSHFKAPKLNAVQAWAIIISIFLLVFNNIVIANISYHKLNMAYQKSYGMLIRIADRIEQTEGTENCDKILVLGALADSESYSAYLPPDMTGTTDGYILRADDENVGQSVLCSALNDYCGKSYTFVYGEEKNALLESISTEEMNIWPKENSVIVKDNVIIIQLGHEVE